MSFSAFKKIELDNLKSFRKTTTDGDVYSNNRVASVHKDTIINYDYEEFVVPKKNITEKTFEEEFSAISAKFIEPYNYKNKDAVNCVVTKDESGYLKYFPDKSIEGSDSITYFWVEDFKNWCTWKINAESYHPNDPYANIYQLCVWNGRNSFIPINEFGTVSIDQEIGKWQNDVLAKCRYYNSICGVVVDNYIYQKRGDFVDENNAPFGGSMPGQQVGGYVLHEAREYSVYDKDTFQAVRYGNPLNINLLERPNNSIYFRDVLNLTLDDAGCQSCYGKDANELESEIWDRTHYNENSDTGYDKCDEDDDTGWWTNWSWTPGNGAWNPVTLLDGTPLGLGISYFFGKRSSKGNHNMMYRWDDNKYQTTSEYYNKIFKDPNYGDVISFSEIKNRYFDNAWQGGLPVQSYVTKEKDVSYPCTNCIYLEFVGNKKGLGMRIYQKNNSLRWENISDSGNEGHWSAMKNGYSRVKYGYAAGRIDNFAGCNKSPKDWNSATLGTWANVTNLNMTTNLSIGAPPVYRLPTGELCLCTNLRLPGPPGLTGYDVEFINDICKQWFGDGRDKTIGDNWLKHVIINNDEEKETSIIDPKSQSLNSELHQQTTTIVNNKAAVKFSTNNIIVTTNVVENNDYAAKW